jgi:hypothetical protein
MKFFAPIALILLCTVPVPLRASIIYLDDNLGQLWEGDPTTNIYTYVGNSTASVEAALGTMSFSGFTDIGFANHVLFGLDQAGNLFSINTGNGTASLVGATGMANPATVVGLTGLNGVLYASGANALYTIDPVTGIPTLLSPSTGNYTTSGDLDFTPNGLFLTSTTDGSGNPSLDDLFSIDPTTGIGTDLGQLQDGSSNAFNSVFGIAYDIDNSTLYGFEYGGKQFQINTSNPNNSVAGTFTETGGGTQDLGGLLGAAADVPEPSTFALMSAAALALAGFARRRK